ncbi:MAG: tetratricopeptide repeat protein [Gammaproteobacteria bacterium]|nr:tetratricopeptide repeat protein [Gammaproteobacteria bacterium]
MEVYETEREQIDAIKKWWKTNGKAVMAGLILGAVSLIGWQQWQAYNKSQREGASMEYEVLIGELQQGNNQAVTDRGKRIMDEYGKTSYAMMTALILAKKSVESGDMPAARTYLQTVVNDADQPEIKQIAQLRLARIMLAQGEGDAALKLINEISSTGFEALHGEIKGDILVSLGKKDEARAAYQAAIKALEPGQDKSVLEMKLDDLGGAAEAHV